jgi:hypothetical protein
VPRAALRNRTLVAANLTAFFTFGAVLSFIFLGSLLMQEVLRYSPTQTGVAWLATTATSFVAAAITGGKLVAVVGVRRLLVAGNSLLAVAVLLLTRVPAGGHYATDLLPALLLAGLAGGLAAPAAQIAALSGVTHSMTGAASGLIETMREIGAAVGIAAVSTILVSRSGEIAGPAGGPVAMDAFHAAYWAIFGAAALGALTAAIAFPRHPTQGTAPAASSVSIPEPMKDSA